MDARQPNERLKEARIAAGFRTAADAAESLGVKAPTYTSHENGTRDFSRQDAVLYGRRFKVSPAWLMFGEQQQTGSKVREVDIRAGAGGGGVESAVMATTKGNVTISADAVAAVWEMPSAYLRNELRMQAENAWVCEVMGDSGYNPELPGAPGSLFPGDRAIIDIGDRRPSPPGAFAVFDGMGLVIKLVEVVQGSEPPRLRLSSRNPSYAPYEVTIEEAHIIGRVKGRISAM